MTCDQFRNCLACSMNFILINGTCNNLTVPIETNTGVCELNSMQLILCQRGCLECTCTNNGTIICNKT